MKKVSDLLVKSGVGGCNFADFVMRETSALQSQPYDPHGDPFLEIGFPLSAQQLQRLKRNLVAPPSNSGNNSHSLASSVDEEDNRRLEASKTGNITPSFLKVARMRPLPPTKTHRQVLHHLHHCIYHFI